MSDIEFIREYVKKADAKNLKDSRSERELKALLQFAEALDKNLDQARAYADYEFMQPIVTETRTALSTIAKTLGKKNEES